MHSRMGRITRLRKVAQSVLHEIKSVAHDRLACTRLVRACAGRVKSAFSILLPLSLSESLPFLPSSVPALLVCFLFVPVVFRFLFCVCVFFVFIFCGFQILLFLFLCVTIRLLLLHGAAFLQCSLSDDHLSAFTRLVNSL